MEDVERRIDLAFEFLAKALEDPEILNAIPDGAIIAFGDDADTSFTERSSKLLHRTRDAQEWRSKEGRDAGPSATQKPLLVTMVKPLQAEERERQSWHYRVVVERQEPPAAFPDMT